MSERFPYVADYIVNKEAMDERLLTLAFPGLSLPGLRLPSLSHLLFTTSLEVCSFGKTPPLSSHVKFLRLSISSHTMVASVMPLAPKMSKWQFPRTCEYVTVHGQWDQVGTFCCYSVTKPCPTLCDPMDCSTPGFPVLHHLLESVHIHVPRVSETVYHLILCHPLLFLPSIFPSIRIFSNESALQH